METVAGSLESAIPQPVGAINSDPLASVIIPAYNHAKFLRDAIESALGQTYKRTEIIVVDDGSTDNTRNVVAKYGDKVSYIWQENKGLGGARNTGIRAAKGKLIGLLDADDKWLPSFLEQMVTLATKHPEAAVYYCTAQGMDASGANLPRQFGGPALSPASVYSRLLRANFLIPSTVMMRRSVVVSEGLFEQSRPSIHGCEDWDLWLRLAPKYDFIGTSACLVRYRLHENTFSAHAMKMQRAVQTVVEKHFGPDDGVYERWSRNKRRAYGGVYRYHLLTSVQHRGDWQAGATYLRLALQTDPTLSTDLELFYELAMGSQPSGYKGTGAFLDLEANATQIEDLLKRLFASASITRLDHVRHKVYGSSYFALGLLAYNTGRPALSRRYFLKALRIHPRLWQDQRLITNLLKSLLGRRSLNYLRRLRTTSWSRTR